MALELTGEQRSKVISLIKRIVAEQGNCRVGWALREIAGEKFENSIHLKEKIANTIRQSGKYIKEESAVAEKDWNILLNPQYKLFQFNKRTVIINVILSIITAIVAIITIGLTIAFHVKP
jgi:hypothetical protein